MAIDRQLLAALGFIQLPTDESQAMGWDGEVWWYAEYRFPIFYAQTPDPQPPYSLNGDCDDPSDVLPAVIQWAKTRDC